MIKYGGNLLLVSDVPHLGVCSIELNRVVNKLEMPGNMRTTHFTDTYMHEINLTRWSVDLRRKLCFLKRQLSK